VSQVPKSQRRRGAGPAPTLILGVLVAVAAVLAAVAFQGEGRRTPSCEDAAATPSFPGTSGPEACALPDPPLERLDTEGTLRFSDLRGRPLVVNFWASWCAPCAAEMPLFAQAARDLDGRVGFVGVDVQDRPEPALELARRSGVAYPLVEDPRGELYEALRGAGMPTTLFVDADGTVVYRRTGEVDAGRLAALLAEHLGVAWNPPPKR
jgi:cytochrome c biogenesis protein CcmG/thiol:disulfide interchange protein DsbE